MLEALGLRFDSTRLDPGNLNTLRYDFERIEFTGAHFLPLSWILMKTFKDMSRVKKLALDRVQEYII